MNSPLHSPLNVTAVLESWELATPFTIARGAMTHADLVVVTVSDGRHVGRGESCPVSHYGETNDKVLAEVHLAAEHLQTGIRWEDLHDLIAPGAARNALDCAIWDLKAKQTGQPVWRLLGLAPPGPLETVFTISLADPATMASAAQKAFAAGYQTLKLKLGAEGDLDRVKAVRNSVPGAQLIADVNEAWDAATLDELLPELARLGLSMLEQPLPSNSDLELDKVPRIVPICADESCHTSIDIAGLVGRYDLVNIKLDKTGGLTEAMRLAATARNNGLDTMIGCMLGTSLAMAPGFLVGQSARYVDLDAPLLIGKDRENAIKYDGSRIDGIPSDLWG